MGSRAYYTVACDVEGCENESSFEPTASEARQAAWHEDWHMRRLGGERWFCPDHASEWIAAAPREAIDDQD